MEKIIYSGNIFTRNMLIIKPVIRIPFTLE